MEIAKCVTSRELSKCGRGKQCRMQYRSGNQDKGVPVRIEELLSQAEEYIIKSI